MLHEIEINRYKRYIQPADIGFDGQEKLKIKNVLVIDAGGLGAPTLLCLSSAWVGRIGVVDFDIVDESNIQRKVIFDSEDTGKSKVEIAKRKLLRINPYNTIVTFITRLKAENDPEL